MIPNPLAVIAGSILTWLVGAQAPIQIAQDYSGGSAMIYQQPSSSNCDPTASGSENFNDGVNSLSRWHAAPFGTATVSAGAMTGATGANGTFHIFHTAPGSVDQWAIFKLTDMNTSGSVGLYFRANWAASVGGDWITAFDTFGYMLSIESGSCTGTAPNFTCDLIWYDSNGTTTATVEEDTAIAFVEGTDCLAAEVVGTGTSTEMLYWVLDCSSGVPARCDWGTPTATMTNDPNSARDTGYYTGVYMPGNTNFSIDDWATGDGQSANAERAGLSTAPSIKGSLEREHGASDVVFFDGFDDGGGSGLHDADCTTEEDAWRDDAPDAGVNCNTTDTHTSESDNVLSLDGSGALAYDIEAVISLTAGTGRCITQEIAFTESGTGQVDFIRTSPGNDPELQIDQTIPAVRFSFDNTKPAFTNGQWYRMNFQYDNDGFCNSANPKINCEGHLNGNTAGNPLADGSIDDNQTQTGIRYIDAGLTDALVDNLAVLKSHCFGR